MTHYIAENPESRGEFLYRIWLYYNKGRKQPELFVKVLNAKNTKGETILDYIESIRLKGYNKHPGLQEPIRKLISFICTNGGVYEAYKEKTCEN